MGENGHLTDRRKWINGIGNERKYEPWQWYYEYNNGGNKRY
jgi:hypothetical protein